MPTEDLERYGQRIKALAEKIINASEGESHRLLLDALMSVYVVVAETHGCCTHAAAMVCKDTACRLENAGTGQPKVAFLH